MLPRKPLVVLGWLLACLACQEAEPLLPPSIPVPEQPAGPCNDLGTLEQAVGEQVTGYGQQFPNWQERVIYVMTNRARSDPAKQMAECNAGSNPYKACPWAEGATPCYSAKAPLVWDLQVSRAARFHATYLSKAPCGLGHNTCCTLVSGLSTSNCDGDPACACVSGTQSCDCNGACGNATGFGARLTALGVTGASGEVAHQWYTDPLDIFYGWVDEALAPASGGTCGFTSNNGHRWLILTSGGPKIGAGYGYKAGNCNSPYWVEDFAGGTATPDRLPGGVHYPQTGSTTTSFRFWANYYHPGGSTPQRAAVVVGGACKTMSLEFGTVQNGTYRLDTKLSSGCQRYYYLFVDSAGTRWTYPTTGSLTISVGSACSSDYEATQQAADCDSAPPDAGMPPDAAAPGLDAAAPGLDAAAPGLDAAAPGLDAAAPGLDAAAPGLDAAAPGLDAAAPGLDAAAPGLDAAAPGLDAAAPGLDAAAPGLDAAAPGLDAAAPGLDAAAPGLDAAAPGLDAAAPGLDAAAPGLDAAAPGLDAAALGLDAASPGLDAAAPGLDAAAPGLDAEIAGVDAAQGGPDAEMPAPDASTAGDDSGTPGLDAGLSAVDGSTVPVEDAALVEADGSFDKSAVVLSGCGCAAGTGVGGWWWAALAGLAVSGLRRRR